MGIKNISAFLLLWMLASPPWKNGLCKEEKKDNDHHPQQQGNNLISLSISNPHLPNLGESRGRTVRNSQRDVITKIRLLPKEKLNRYKVDAVRHLQGRLIHCFHAISISMDIWVPAEIRAAAKQAISATQSGRLTPAILANLGVILRKGCQQQGHPAAQFQVILETLLPHARPPTYGVLQNLVGFVNANLVGVNGLLAQVLGGAPDLLDGVIKSLTKSLGAVTGALTGSLSSLGILLGGALA